MVIINRRLMVLTPIILVISVIAMLFGINPLYSLSVGLIILMICIYTKTIYKDFSLVFFLTTFFFFLMSSEFVKEVLGIEVVRDTIEAADLHYQIVILLSLVGIFIGYQIRLRANDGIDFKQLDFSESIEKRIARKVSKNVFYITFLFYLAPVLEKIIFVREYSYYLSYVYYSSSIPLLLVKFGDMCPIAFAIFLATFPEKKECRIPIIVYVIYAVAYLFTGRRFMTVASLVFIIAYCLIRNKTDEVKGIIWIKKKTIILLIALMPIVGVALAAYSTIRTGASLTSGTSVGNLLYTLFTSVADSDRVIKYGYMYRDQFPSGHIYSFGSVIDYIRYGSISNIITGSSVTVSQTAEYALKGSGYSYTLSYLYYPSKFLAGNGLGSCYIAELFHDAGYFGVISGNIVLGALLRNIFAIYGNSLWKNAITFYVFKLVLLTPRNDFDVVLRELLSISFLATFIFIFLIVNHLKTQYRIKRQ